MNPRRRRFGWILGGGDPWSSWTLAATANIRGLRRQLWWPVRRIEGASIHPRGWCRDLVPTLVNQIIPHRIPTTLLHLANDVICILCFPTDQCHFCLVGGNPTFVSSFLGWMTSGHQSSSKLHVAFGICIVWRQSIWGMMPLKRRKLCFQNRISHEMYDN